MAGAHLLGASAVAPLMLVQFRHVSSTSLQLVDFEGNNLSEWSHSVPIRQACWGDSAGLLLDANNNVFVLTMSTPRVPLEMPSGICINSVASGTNFSLFLSTEGLVLALGDNSQGQCAMDNCPSLTTPTVIVSLANAEAVAAIACGSAHALCLDVGGNVHLWGENKNDRLLVGQMHQPICWLPTKSRFLSPGSSRMIASGASFCLATDDAQHLWCWGGSPGAQWNMQLPDIDMGALTCSMQSFAWMMLDTDTETVSDEEVDRSIPTAPSVVPADVPAVDVPAPVPDAVDTYSPPSSSPLGREEDHFSRPAARTAAAMDWDRGNGDMMAVMQTILQTCQHMSDRQEALENRLWDVEGRLKHFMEGMEEKRKADEEKLQEKLFVAFQMVENAVSRQDVKLANVETSLQTLASVIPAAANLFPSALPPNATTLPIRMAQGGARAELRPSAPDGVGGRSSGGGRGSSGGGGRPGGLLRGISARLPGGGGHKSSGPMFIRFDEQLIEDVCSLGYSRPLVVGTLQDLYTRGQPCHQLQPLLSELEAKAGPPRPQQY